MRLSISNDQPRNAVGRSVSLAEAFPEVTNGNFLAFPTVSDAASGAKYLIKLPWKGFVVGIRKIAVDETFEATLDDGSTEYFTKPFVDEILSDSDVRHFELDPTAALRTAEGNLVGNISDSPLFDGAIMADVSTDYSAEYPFDHDYLRSFDIRHSRSVCISTRLLPSLKKTDSSYAEELDLRTAEGVRYPNLCPSGFGGIAYSGSFGTQSKGIFLRIQDGTKDVLDPVLLKTTDGKDVIRILFDPERWTVPTSGLVAVVTSDGPAMAHRELENGRSAFPRAPRFRIRFRKPTLPWNLRNLRSDWTVASLSR